MRTPTVNNHIVSSGQQEVQNENFNNNNGNNHGNVLKEFENSLKHSIPTNYKTVSFEKVVTSSSNYFSYFDFKLLNPNFNFNPHPGRFTMKTFK